MEKPTFRAAAGIFLSALIYLNIAAMAVAALWLGLVGQWQVIWIGCAMLFASPYVVPILLIPSGILSHFMSKFAASGRRGAERLLLVCTLGYVIGFIALWCALVFGYVMNNIAPSARVVGLLWSASSALLPLLWWASRDRNNLFIIMLVEVAQFALLLPVVTHLRTGQTAFWTCFFSIAGVLAAETLFQAAYEKKFLEKK